jgi:hypothetical protein
VGNDANPLAALDTICKRWGWRMGLSVKGSKGDRLRLHRLYVRDSRNDVRGWVEVDDDLPKAARTLMQALARKRGVR